VILTIISKKYGIKEVIIDDEDYDKVKSYKWYINKDRSSNIFYVVHSSDNKHKYIMHRLIMDCPKGMIVDHINHNTLDNRKENLRICTNSENLRNSRLQKNNTTGYKGVFFNKTWNNYKVTIGTKKNRKYLGSYKNIEDAAKAYNEAAIKYYGEFACLNEVENV